MRILVITSCTGEKTVEHPAALNISDFEKGINHVATRERELADVLTPAENLYSGLQHIRLMRRVHAVRERASEINPPISVDLWILSAGYGLIPGTRPIAPYECTFQGMKKVKLRDWADRLRVPEEVRRLVSDPYDLALLLLGDSYLEACALDKDVALGGPTIAFCGTGSLTRLRQIPRLHPVPVANADAKRFSCGLVGLKGELAARILERLQVNPNFLLQLQAPDADILALLEKDKVAASIRKTARANQKVDKIVQIPSSWWQKPHREKLRYFIPEWDDLVDPEYDFDTDTHSGGSGDWSNEVYAHQMYPEPNYDGILISKIVAEKSKKKAERINRLGVHRYLRMPREFPIMGDCGAFGYIQREDPPYTTNEILDYYERLDFDYGVSIDHLIVTATEDQKKHRYELTIHNAHQFLNEHKKRGFTWTPIGAVQGWDPKTYAEAARQTVAMGYQYIGLGGLVRTSTPEILAVLQEVKRHVPDSVNIHLFGVARLNALKDFSRLGVRSVDSASYLRQAWMRTKESYLLPDGSTFAALRIPPATKSFRAKRMTEYANLDEYKVRIMEQKALRAVRGYARREVVLESCLDALMEYDRFVMQQRTDLRGLYRRTLLERPWEQCECQICKAIGIEVVIFRGNNRNRRRGFHNTFAFYKLFLSHLNGQSIVPESKRSAVKQMSLEFSTGGAG